MRNNEVGRSMIEMLGVLAIVGVLSVGGIAGFSKAMTKYKFDRSLASLSLFIQEVMSYQKDWNRAYYDVYSAAGQQYWLTTILMEAGLKPDSWRLQDEKHFVDELGGQHAVDARGNNTIEFQYTFGDKEDASVKERPRYYTAIISEVLKPLENFYNLSFWKGSTRFGDVIYGKAYCTEEQVCLEDLTLGEIYERCADCAKNGSSCGLVYILK